jgi:DNA-binding NtrC family response regulator
MTSIQAFSDVMTTRFLDDDSTLFVALEPGMTLADFERLVILQTLKRHSQNRTHTAKALGIGIRTLQRKIKQYGEETSSQQSQSSSPAVAHFY